MSESRIGIDLIGAKGGVATTAILGLTLLRDGLMPRNGLVSELPAFQEIGLTFLASFFKSSLRRQRAGVRSTV